jgi:hypothetical protein
MPQMPYAGHPLLDRFFLVVPTLAPVRVGLTRNPLWARDTVKREDSGVNTRSTLSRLFSHQLSGSSHSMLPQFLHSLNDKSCFVFTKIATVWPRTFVSQGSHL